jgi:hypothetical protein
MCGHLGEKGAAGGAQTLRQPSRMGQYHPLLQYLWICISLLFFRNVSGEQPPLAANTPGQPLSHLTSIGITQEQRDSRGNNPASSYLASCLLYLQGACAVQNAPWVLCTYTSAAITWQISVHAYSISSQPWTYADTAFILTAFVACPCNTPSSSCWPLVPHKHLGLHPLLWGFPLWSKPVQSNRHVGGPR